jgi:NAD(P)-dependent dehydrogenase (short-subunit alcohol dehydrogenase family)
MARSNGGRFEGRFEGKVVLVTGGGTGIGRAIVEAFLAEGARVAITGRRREPLDALAKGREKQVLAVQGDVSVGADRERVIATTVRELGRLDVLVNNAAIFVGGPLAETKDEDAARALEVNVLAPFALTRVALPHLLKSKGSVVNISSGAATSVNAGMSIYSATKAALDHITRLLAAELGPQGIRVNTVSPGVTVTDMAAGLLADDALRTAFVARTPLGRVGQPQDIAPVVVFLASPEAGWVTGQTVAASGGL